METPQLYALLVGINDYPSINKLSGCVADAEAVEGFLRGVYQDSPEKLHLKKLLDAEATRENIIKTFREHLTQAKAGDTVYFHFSGHGSREDAPVEFHNFFPEGKNETLVCYDSRGFGNRDASEYYDLADKELAILIEEVAQNNPHIIISLDSCHSGGASRSGKEHFARSRQAETQGAKRGLASYLDGYYEKQLQETGKIAIPTASHIIFSACNATEVAWETTENRGFFTQTLLEVLNETSLQVSYAEIFERVQIRIRQKKGDQTPQVEAFGQASIWCKFLTEEKLANNYENPVVFFDAPTNTWQLKAGALQGLLPIAENETLPTISIYTLDMKEKIGTASIASILLESCLLIDLETSFDTDLEFEENQAYRADISALNITKVNFFHNNLPDFTPDKLLLPPVFKWTDQMEGADYYIGNYENEQNEQTGELKIAHLHTQKIIQKARETEYLRDVFRKISKWEVLRVLQNAKTAFKQEDITLRLEIDELVQGATVPRTIDIGEDNKIFLDILKSQQGIGFIAIPYRLYATNNSSRPVHIAVLQISPLYGISELNNVAVPEKSSEVLLFEGKKGKSWGFLSEQEAQGDTESDILTKFIVSTKRIDAVLLTQDNFSLNLRDSNTKNADRTQIGGFDIASNYIDPDNVYDWFTKDLYVHLSKEQSELSIKKPETSVGTFKFAAPVGFAAKISVENIDTNTRGVGDTSTAVWKRLAQQPNVTLLQAGKGSRSTTGGQEIITLSNVQGNVSEDKPLKIKLKDTLQEGEMYVSFALDGDLLVPIGISATDNPQVIEIYNLPETDQQANSRSIGRAIRFCLSKITSKIFGTDANAWFQLRKVTYTEEGTALYDVYDAHNTSIKQDVAQANRVLLLIHGIIGNTTDMVEFAKQVAGKTADKYDCVLTFDYENLNTSIETIAHELKTRLEAVGISKDKKIDIIAHSMGGLVSRSMIEKSGGNEFVNRLIMCGTPNGGSNFGKIEQFRKIASIGALIGANLFAPFSAVAWLVSALKGAKAVTGGGAILFNTLGQMDRSSDFIKGLNNGRSGDIPYFILAGNVQNYQPENAGLWQKIVNKTLEGVGNAVNLGEANDIAVLTEDIKQTGKNTDVKIFDIPCHHLNYFVEENSVKTLLEILK